MKHTKGQDLSVNVAHNVKRLRLRKKLTLRALGAMCELSGVYVWQVEAGIRHPTLVAIGKLADGLGVAVSDLLKAPKVKPKK